MYASSTFILTAIVALARVATATPPACLLAALGVQANPADLKSLCGSLEPQIAGNITEKCEGDNLSSAQSVFSATCLSSESVTISFTSSTSSSSKSRSVSATTTSSGSHTTSSASSSSGSSSGASSSSSSVSKTTATPTATGSGTVASETGKSAASAMAPQNGFIIAPLVLAVGIVGQYIL